MKEDRLKHHVNELANENADLKVTVGKMRYKADEAEPEAAPSVVMRTVSNHHIIARSTLVRFSLQCAYEDVRSEQVL